MEEGKLHRKQWRASFDTSFAALRCGFCEGEEFSQPKKAGIEACLYTLAEAGCHCRPTAAVKQVFSIPRASDNPSPRFGGERGVGSGGRKFLVTSYDPGRGRGKTPFPKDSQSTTLNNWHRQKTTLVAEEELFASGNVLINRRQADFSFLLLAHEGPLSSLTV